MICGVRGSATKTPADMLDDGTDIVWFVKKLNYELAAVDVRSEALVESVRGVVIFSSEESSATTTEAVPADATCPPLSTG